MNPFLNFCTKLSFCTEHYKNSQLQQRHGLPAKQ